MTSPTVNDSHPGTPSRPLSSGKVNTYTVSVPGEVPSTDTTGDSTDKPRTIGSTGCGTPSRDSSTASAGTPRESPQTSWPCEWGGSDPVQIKQKS